MSFLPEDWPGGYERVVLPETDSTLDEARRRFEEMAQPQWLLALNQTKARGRRGRPWSNPKGNFAASLVLPLSESPDRMAMRSFVAALSLFDAFVAVTGRTDPFALKWPNDVLLNGGKVAGILLETLTRKGRVAGVAVGIGVNLVEAPGADEVEAGARRPVSLAQETGALVRPEEFLNVLASQYAAHEVTFRTFGFEPIRKAWLGRAAHLGETITARFGNQSLSGIFETIDAQGHLVLKVNGTRHTIAAAEVFF